MSKEMGKLMNSTENRLSYPQRSRSRLERAVWQLGVLPPFLDRHSCRFAENGGHLLLQGLLLQPAWPLLSMLGVEGGCGHGMALANQREQL
jgi:hypothetical protein